MANIKDIAKYCGVTAATVSLALNKHPRISQSRREEIQAVAQKLGYQPSAVAQNLRRGRSNSIGILWSIDSGEAIRDLTIGLMAKGFISHLVDSLSDPEIIKNSLKDYIRYKVDGLIMQANMDLLEDEGIRTLLKVIPNKIIVIEGGKPGCSIGDNDFDLIYRDHITPWKEAIAHFRLTRRKRVALVGQSLNAIREKAFTKYLKQYGFPVRDSRMIIPIETELKTLTPEIEAELLAKPLKYDAILTTNDELAAAVIGLFLRNGIKVPGQVVVAGFNDERMSRYFIPALATVDRREQELTQLLLGRIFEKLANPKTEPLVETVKMHFIRRESAG